ncbi:MAG: ribonuclease R [Sphingobacteriales bacterium]|nr:MAG: ribonuclease R [Sphingobacteriales bacterium]
MAGRDNNSKKTKPSKKAPAHSFNTYKGKIELTRSGTGFVTVVGQARDIIVYREHLHGALNGDEVVVAITKVGREGRQEGTIKSVTTRKQNEFRGRLEVKENFAFFIADAGGLSIDIFIPLHLLHGAIDGDRVVVKVVDWAESKKNPIGEVVRVVTGESLNEMAMQGILMEAGFPLSFPDDVLEDAARYSEHIDTSEVRKRRDFRNVLTMTIDPVDAKDFDDALSFVAHKDGSYEVGVHIADVAHFIEADSALDKEAYNRATSVYLPDRVLPMLPERLSNELCSLRPNEDKYAFSAVFQIDKKGKIKEYWLGRTLIRSARRFTYEEVQDILEGASGDHEEVLRTLNEIAQNLRAARFKKGAINFSSQEVRFVLDDEARPVDVVVKESKEAHQLIEEFMLLANRTVAKHVGDVVYKDKPLPFPYRVHDQPDEAKLAMFAAYAARYGHKFDLKTPQGIAKSFNQMLKLAEGKPEQHVLESLGIRTMAKAVYTTENIGHYGLGFEYYCHFTSPIRRYPDVLVHRILAQVLEGHPMPIKGLEQKSRHCSDRERSAMEAERAANKYKQVEYMRQFLGEEFDAVVSGVSSFGFWAETVDTKCEGMVSIQDLNAIDSFELPEGEYALVGRHTRMRFQMGDKVRVKVVSANLEKRTIDYHLVTAPQPEKPKAAKASGRKKKA